MELINSLSAQLTYDEFSTARDIFIACQDKRIPTLKAAAICYRAGRLKSKAEAELKIKQVHAAKHVLSEELKQLQAEYDKLLSLPKATAETTETEQEQGESTNE